MKKFHLYLILTALLIAPIGSAYAAPEPAQISQVRLFDVEIVMHDGVRLVAEPRMRVAAGEPGRIEIEPGDGSHYRMDFSVSAAAAEALSFSSTLDVRSVTASSTANLHASPRLKMRAGETGQIVVGYDTDEIEPFRVDFVIRPVTG